MTFAFIFYSNQCNHNVRKRTHLVIILVGGSDNSRRGHLVQFLFLTHAPRLKMKEDEEKVNAHRARFIANFLSETETTH